MDCMKALAVVAHPDDCVIFGYGYITETPADWTICYLTYTEKSPRGKEIKRFWDSRNIKTIFLGFPDNFNDIKQNRLSFNVHQAEEKIIELIKDYDLILTHNDHGEYGHPHHIFLNNIIEHNNIVNFAYPENGNLEFLLDRDSYDLNMLPLHKDAINNFQTQSHLRYGYWE